MVVHKLTQNAHNSSSGGIFGYIIRFFLRFLQFVLALAVAGLYGQDLSNAQKAGAYADGKWVYAVVVAGLSAITALIYALPKIKSWAFFPWDFIVFILWIALFGIFGKMYIGEDPEGDSGVTRMLHAVWVDLVNMILWFITTVYSASVFFIHRRRHTLHTGRAEA